MDIQIRIQEALCSVVDKKSTMHASSQALPFSLSPLFPSFLPLFFHSFLFFPVSLPLFLCFLFLFVCLFFHLFGTGFHCVATLAILEQVL